MTLSLKQLVRIAISASLISSCSCDEGNGANDSGPDASDTDTWPDAVDPEIDWVDIPAGSFVFGSPVGTPCQGPVMEKEVQVTLTRPFVMSQYEITQRQWEALGFPLPHRAIDCADCPITFVNTQEAKAWCNALSRFEGLEECYDLSTCTGEIGAGCPDGDYYELGCHFVQYSSPIQTIDGLYVCPGAVRRYASMYDCAGYRLPTGPEWEYAAKAGTTTNTYNGDMTDDHGSQCADEPILTNIAWYCSNTDAGNDDWHPDQIREVGLKQPNPWGLYDVLGNAGEWVDYVSTGFSLDDNDDKPDQALIDPMGAAEDQDGRGDVRGGFSFRQPCYVRSSYQIAENRNVRGSVYGFRPVRTLPAGVPDAGVK